MPCGMGWPLSGRPPLTKAGAPGSDPCRPVASPAPLRQKELRAFGSGTAPRRQFLPLGTNRNIPGANFVRARRLPQTISRRLRPSGASPQRQCEQRKPKRAHCERSHPRPRSMAECYCRFRALGAFSGGSPKNLPASATRRLHLAQFVRAARQQRALFPVPPPVEAKAGMRHAIGGRPQLSVLPFLSAVGGYFHPLNQRPRRTRLAR